MFAVFIFFNGIFSQGVASLIFLFLSNNREGEHNVNNFSALSQNISFSSDDENCWISLSETFNCTEHKTYRIRPNYRTVRLGFQKYWETCGKKTWPTYTKSTLKNKKKKISEGLIKWCLCDVFVLFFFSNFL